MWPADKTDPEMGRNWWATATRPGILGSSPASHARAVATAEEPRTERRWSPVSSMKRQAVMKNGKRRWRSARGLVLLFLRNRATEGDWRAFRGYHDCLARFGPQHPNKVGGYLVVPEVLSEAE